MNWGSSEAFFAMGGYALYVWGSYLVTFAFMLWEVVALVLRRRGVLRMLRDALVSRGLP